MPDGTMRRGVTFIRELVPKALVASVARIAYNEPYRALPMRSDAPAGATEAPGRVAHEWQIEGAWQRVAATASGGPLLPSRDSEATFITEHYWGYGRPRTAARPSTKSPIRGGGSGMRRRPSSRGIRPRSTALRSWMRFLVLRAPRSSRKARQSQCFRRRRSIVVAAHIRAPSETPMFGCTSCGKTCCRAELQLGHAK